VKRTNNADHSAISISKDCTVNLVNVIGLIKRYTNGPKTVGTICGTKLRIAHGTKFVNRHDRQAHEPPTV